MSIKEKHIKDDNEYVREKKELILSEKQEGLIELPFKRFIGLLHMEDWRKGAFCMEDPVSIEVRKGTTGNGQLLNVVDFKTT